MEFVLFIAFSLQFSPSENPSMHPVMGVRLWSGGSGGCTVLPITAFNVFVIPVRIVPDQV